MCKFNFSLCMNMDDEPTSTSDISLETSPPSPQDVLQESSYGDDPGRSADVPPDPSRSVARERPYYDGLALQLVQQTGYPPLARTEASRICATNYEATLIRQVACRRRKAFPRI